MKVPRPILSTNDLKTVASIVSVTREHDAYCPHGIADWTAIRRLEAMGLIKYEGIALCVDCDCASSHDSRSYTLTDAGRNLASAG